MLIPFVRVTVNTGANLRTVRLVLSHWLWPCINKCIGQPRLADICHCEYFIPSRWIALTIFDAYKAKYKKFQTTPRIQFPQSSLASLSSQMSLTT